MNRKGNMNIAILTWRQRNYFQIPTLLQDLKGQQSTQKTAKCGSGILLQCLLIPTSCNVRHSVTSALIFDPARMTEVQLQITWDGGKEIWGCLKNACENMEINSLCSESLQQLQTAKNNIKSGKGSISTPNLIKWSSGTSEKVTETSELNISGNKQKQSSHLWTRTKDLIWYKDSHSLKKTSATQ